MSEIIKEAFEKLYPEKEFNYSAVLKYSGKFRGYNARVQLNKFSNELTFNLSSKWKTVNKQIQLGLIQSLLVKILKLPAQSIEIELYELFLKALSDSLPRNTTHPLLEESFKRVNEKYFVGLLSMPSFELKNSSRVLGTYEYSTDTVSITQMLLAHPELLDYVMYHELLHKKHKFSSKNGRHSCHTKAFRDDEKKFENAELLEKELNRLITKHTIKNKARNLFRFL